MAAEPAGPAPEEPRGPRGFRSIESLWDALERYHYYHESCIMRKLDGGGARSAERGHGIQITDQWADIMEVNQVIDQAMIRLAVVDPRLHALLHRFYRCGLCEEAGSRWPEAARYAGLTTIQKNAYSKALFDWAVERAVHALFACHRGIANRTPGRS